MSYFSIGQIGAAFTATDDGSNGFEVGTQLQGNDNTTFIRVQCGSATALTEAGFAVAIDKDFRISKLTPAKAIDGSEVGLALNTFTADAFGWVAVNGVELPAKLLGTANSGLAIGIGSSDGILVALNTGATQTMLDGVHCVANPASAQALGTVTLQFPHASISNP